MFPGCSGLRAALLHGNFPRSFFAVAQGRFPALRLTSFRRRDNRANDPEIADRNPDKVSGPRAKPDDLNMKDVTRVHVATDRPMLGVLRFVQRQVRKLRQVRRCGPLQSP